MVDNERRLASCTSQPVKFLNLLIHLLSKLALCRRRVSYTGFVFSIEEDCESWQIVLTWEMCVLGFVGCMEDIENKVDPAPSLDDEKARALYGTGPVLLYGG